MPYEDMLKEINRTLAVCWKCKSDMCEEDMVTVTDGHSIRIELCHNCYDLYQEIRESVSGMKEY